MSWHAEQPLLIPVCCIAVPGPNFDVDAWQVAQSLPVGRWPEPWDTGVTPRNASPPTAAAWHVVQPLLMPLWFITPGLYVGRLAWHRAHACVVGMWFVGSALARAKDVVVWQVPQSPVRGWFASWVGDGRTTIVTPKKLFPASWHVAHEVPATGAWFIAVPPNVEKAVAA